MDGVKVSGFKS